MTTTTIRPIRSVQGMQVTIETITPEIAARMLENNPRNRHIIERHVASLVHVFLAGEMILNGMSIKFDTLGNLIDGQHRLTACVRSGVPFTTLVARNVTPEAFDTIDQISRPRNYKDILSIETEESPKNLSAAVRSLTIMALTRAVGSEAAGVPVTIGGMSRVLENHPGIRNSVKEITHCRLYRTAPAAMLHYLFTVVDADLAESFFDCLKTGSARIGSPMHIFRESMINAQTKNMRTPQRAIAARAIKAWNFSRRGVRVRLISWKSNEEEFPLIDGLDYEWLAATV